MWWVERVVVVVVVEGDRPSGTHFERVWWLSFQLCVIALQERSGNPG